MTPIHAFTPRPAIVLVALLLVQACGSSTEPPLTGVPDTLNALPRTLSAAEQQGVTASNTFALNLLRTTTAGSVGNVLLSPLSVSTALALTMNGSAAETENEMRTVLGWNSATRAEVNGAYRDLAALLPTIDPAVTFKSANALWMRDPYQPDTGFVSDATRYFNASVRTASSPQAMFDAVNAWGSEKTDGLIPKVLTTPPPANLVMLLANALLFKGQWREPFDPAETSTQPFTLENGTAISMPLMQRKGSFRAARGAGVAMVELSYGNTAYSMLLVLPDTGKVGSLIARLTLSELNSMIASLAPVATESRVYVPRFKVSGTVELKPMLMSMGMPRAFTDAAQFPRLIVNQTDLKMEFVRHSVALEVDEVGTRAAAVTVVGIGLTSAPPSYRFDRPFVFFIRERLTGTLLFSGIIRDPRT